MLWVLIGFVAYFEGPMPQQSSKSELKNQTDNDTRTDTHGPIVAIVMMTAAVLAIKLQALATL